MKAVNKFRRRRRIDHRLIPMVGILLLWGFNAAAQTRAISGTNDAPVSVSASERDPFWPVGYVPERLIKATEKQTAPVKKVLTGNKDWSGAMKKVAINGVSSRSDHYFAIVNGELKSVGDTFSVEHNGTTYTWAVASIKPPGSVRLRRVSAL
ncbi:hypothetical protein [Pontiella agarivorans]|uniref:Uncharacterized protein n=1 Tax=Pontiella agarivorans TaxID=3038953 RepID=A0ABU5MYV8_9BACT|nr:hypothetical protein [Pontiella agarivorans]MDZ8119391.1 hypothetical protein [Pontiella agarivorans]